VVATAERARAPAPDSSAGHGASIAAGSVPKVASWAGQVSWHMSTTLTRSASKAAANCPRRGAGKAWGVYMPMHDRARRGLPSGSSTLTGSAGGMTMPT
jgi:hypothetical protein